MVEKLKQTIRRRRSIMVQAEWRHLVHSKMLLVAVIAILFIPVLYAAIFLSAVWDPYGNTEHLPIAFVNEDRGARLGDKSLNVGKSVADSLATNKKIGWEFVDINQARDGVKRGHYYAVVSVPADFSARAASLTQKQPQRATMTYTLTPAKNYVGSIISRQAAQNIKTTIAQEISQAYVKEVMTGVTNIGQGMDRASRGAAQLHAGTAQLQQGLRQYTTGVHQLANNQTTLTNGLTQLRAGAARLQQGTQQLSSGVPTSGQINQLVQGLQSVQQGLRVLDASVAQPSPVMSSQQQAVTDNAQSLAASLQASQPAMIAAGAAVQTAMTQAAANNGATTMTLPQLQAIAQALAQTKAIATESQKLLGSLQALTNILTTQQQNLKGGVGTIRAGMDRVVPPTVMALQGYNTVRSGSERLATGVQQLSTGLVVAQQGSRQLTHGAMTLDANSHALLNGTKVLADGSATLGGALQSGAAQVALIPAGAPQQQQIVTPVQAHEATNGNVPNYGYAMAPYMISLALFVGGLALTTMYPVRKTFSRQENPWRWWLAKMSVLGLAALIQAMILMVVMVSVVGLQPDHPWQFIGASCLASFTFISIITLLVMVFDNPGRLLVMILMVLQLAASEGIFPIQTAPQFFQAINPWLPMTHSIIALREAISGGIDRTIFDQHMMVLTVFLVIANAALLGFFAWRGTRRFAHQSVDGD